MVLNHISALSYPSWLTNVRSYLPKINLGCIAQSGVPFLNEAAAASKTATISGFLNAITAGCSTITKSLLLTGGYDSETQELELNIVVQLEGSQNA